MLCLIRSTETLKFSFFAFISEKSKWKLRENEGRKKVFYLFPRFPSSLFCAYVFVCTSPSAVIMDHNTVLTTCAVWILNLSRCVSLIWWLGHGHCFVTSDFVHVSLRLYFLFDFVCAFWSTFLAFVTSHRRMKGMLTASCQFRYQKRENLL